MGERCEFSDQVQLTAFEGRLQSSHELAAKHAPQHNNVEITRRIFCADIANERAVPRRL
jgi:hypothetical protein